MILSARISKALVNNKQCASCQNIWLLKVLCKMHSSELDIHRLFIDNEIYCSNFCMKSITFGLSAFNPIGLHKCTCQIHYEDLYSAPVRLRPMAGAQCVYLLPFKMHACIVISSHQHAYLNTCIRHTLEYLLIHIERRTHRHIGRRQDA